VNVCINISFIEKGIEFYFEEIFTLSFFGRVSRNRSDYTWKRGNVRALLRVPYQQQRRFTETPELLSTKLSGSSHVPHLPLALGLQLHQFASAS
jgi:hypothetical protein